MMTYEDELINKAVAETFDMPYNPRFSVESGKRKVDPEWLTQGPIMSDDPSPAVGIVMGSDSDWPKIKAVAAALDQFDVPYEIRVMSAHRTPEVVREFAASAADRGLKVIIAAAGGAAHLAGVVASHTILPVIGLPVPTSMMGGLDSLLSIVQMPGDVPVASVGVGMGGPRNAGLLAVQIMALSDDGLRKKLLALKRGLSDKVAARNAALQKTIRQQDQ